MLWIDITQFSALNQPRSEQIHPHSALNPLLMKMKRDKIADNKDANKKNKQKRRKETE